MTTNSRQGAKAQEPKPVLKDGVVYSSDNGQMICSKCAGQSALFSGRDISGQKVRRQTAADARAWFAFFGKPLKCERGCTEARA